MKYLIPKWRIVLIIALTVALTGVGCWRSVQVFNLTSTLHMVETTRNIQAVVLHKRLETINQKGTELKQMFDECKATILEIYEQLQLCDHHYQQCIIEKTVDNGSERREG